MSSSKCKKCGLVNFSYASECKRCLNPFNNQQSKSTHFQNYQMPPPPPVFSADEAIYDNPNTQPKPPCIKCGNIQNISIYNFKKKYVSPIALLGIFIGLLPFFILRWLLSTTHFLSAPFCHNCWNRFRKAETIATLNILGFFVLLVGGIIFAISRDSEFLLLMSFVAAILFYVFGLFYIGTISPKYKKVDAKQVIIDAPLIGDILYTK